MKQTLSAHEHQLSKVFTSDYQFSIPDYQRPYRWGVDQALQLLEDLADSSDRATGDPYFLGSLVLVETGDRAYDVIDGQQRLTTLTILFAVLRELASPEFAVALGALVREPGNVLEGHTAQPRVALRKQDRGFFAKYVQEPDGLEALLALSDHAVQSGPQRAIRDNASALHDVLLGWDDERREGFAQFVSTKTYLVVVSTPDLDSAYRIFSVMNARGLDLTPADIFKSRVVGALGEDEPESRRWEDLEDSLGSDAFTDLFRDIRTIESGERARRELLREFPEQVLDRYLDVKPSRAAEFVREVLDPYGTAFIRTIARDFGPGNEWAEVNAMLRRLDAIDNTDWRPVALWALKAHPDEPDELLQVLRKLERLAAVMLLRGEYNTPRVVRYLDAIKQLKGGAGADAEAFILSPEETRQAVSAINSDVYRMQSRRARFILLRLDELLADDPGVTYSLPILSIEHVLPQTPSDGSVWRQTFTDEEREYWVHKLGNLVLLNRRKNSQASNYDFEQKKARYFMAKGGSTIFALTSQVLSHAEWNPEVLEHRQRKLVRVLTKAWDLERDQ